MSTMAHEHKQISGFVKDYLTVGEGLNGTSSAQLFLSGGAM